MSDCLQQVYDTILDRRDHPVEKSYTHYLFEQGLDKMLKKVGEECAETIIAMKNGEKEDTVGEIADLAYHLLVAMAEVGITPADIEALLNERHNKAGNLKTFHKTDKNT